MRRAILIVTVLLLSGCTTDPSPDHAGNSDQPEESWLEGAEFDGSGTFSKPLEPGLYEASAPIVERVVMDDGIEIATAAWTPQGLAKSPVVLMVDSYRASDMEFLRLDERHFHENFVGHGYTYAHASVRGAGASGGCMDLWGPREQADIDALITHFAGQPWSTGEVFMIGASYGGTTAWEGAASGNPNLKAIVAAAAVVDLKSWMQPNGVTMTANVFTPLAYYVLEGFGSFTSGMVPGRAERWPENLCQESVMAFAELYGSAAAPVSPNPSYWTDRDLRDRARDFEGAFVIQGLDDGIVFPTQAIPFANRLNDTKLLMGNWAHTWPDHQDLPDETRRLDLAEEMLRWFDAHRTDTHYGGPRASLQDQTDAWRDKASYEDGIASIELHLGGYEHDTSNLQSARGWMSWNETEAYEVIGANTGAIPSGVFWNFEGVGFGEGVRFTGRPEVNLTVSVSGPVGMLGAWLYVDGKSQGYERFDLRARNGGNEPMPVNTPVAISFALKPLDAVLPADAPWTLVLVPNVQPEAVTPIPSVMTLHTGEGQSTLRLPVGPV